MRRPFRGLQVPSGGAWRRCKCSWGWGYSSRSFSIPFSIFQFGGYHVNVCQYEMYDCANNVPFVTGATPFMVSTQSADVATVKYFLDHGGDLVKADDKGRTVLHHAVGIGCCKVTEFLLSKGVPIDIDCGRGTPLFWAANNEQNKTVKILLEHHANPNIIINGTTSPLMSALVYRSLKCMKLLIKAGADVNCNGSMLTPLLLATMHGGYTNFIKLLLKSGADPNIPDDVYVLYILLIFVGLASADHGFELSRFGLGMEMVDRDGTAAEEDEQQQMARKMSQGGRSEQRLERRVQEPNGNRGGGRRTEEEGDRCRAAKCDVGARSKS
uniref:Uncharacterized protein n=1 Tax=Triticum aestivum TaxID=4565 RepID=A0A077RXE5_WHEAT|nr:unnamed protein product [Triticum aestivum]